jgi:hypothetical protein
MVVGISPPHAFCICGNLPPKGEMEHFPLEFCSPALPQAQELIQITFHQERQNQQYPKERDLSVQHGRHAKKFVSFL